MGPLVEATGALPAIYIFFEKEKKFRKKSSVVLKAKKNLVDIKHCDFTKYINIKRDRSNKGPKFDEYEEKL